MLRHSIISQIPITLLQRDRKKCACIAYGVIIQCLIVFIASATVLQCVWSPDKATLDYDKLARIMYLYDSQACGHTLHARRGVSSIHLSNDTRGLDVFPIIWAPAIVTVSTRLSAKTRKNIELSLAVHSLWLIVGIGFRFFTRSTTTLRSMKISLAIYLYMTIFVIAFDLSMAIVYIAHVQQSLTKGMILRYSGWSIELKLRNYDDFGGWLPIIAAVCWMRGIFLLIINIYTCQIICAIRRRVRKKEYGKRLNITGSSPIPEANYNQPSDPKILYYRMGENLPYVNNNFVRRVFD